MREYANIIDDLKRRGFCAVPIAEKLFDDALRICQSIYSLSSKQLIQLRANESTGLLGYYPAEIVLRELEREEAATFSHLPTKRERGYCSFDYLQPSCAEFGSPLFKGNQELPSLSLNRELVDVVERLQGYLGECCHGILKELSSSPNSPKVDAEILKNPINLVRFLRYPPRSHKDQESKPHTDYEFLTLIIADRDGLEVKGSDGIWRGASCTRPNAILLPGDMLQDVTEGALASAMHRVKHGSEERRSVIIFHGVNCDYHLRTQYAKETVSFRQHLCSMLLRGAPHLDENDPALILAAGGMVLKSNPFKTGKED